MSDPALDPAESPSPPRPGDRATSPEDRGETFNPSAETVRVFTRERMPMLLVLMAAGAFTSVTGSTVAPVLPEVVAQLGVSDRWSGVLLSMHTFTIALFGPLAGLLADRIGKKRVLLTGLVVYAIAGTSGIWMPDFGTLLASRALAGAAAGSIAAAGIGWLSSIYEGDARAKAMGYATSILAIASIIFPLAGGLLGSFGWQYAFCLYLLALPVAAIAAAVLQEDRNRSGSLVDPAQLGDLRRTLVRPATLVMLLALGLVSSLFATVVVYGPLYFRETIDASTALNGIILASRAVGAAIVAAVGASRLAKRLGPERAIALGFGLATLTLLAIPVFREPALIIGAALVFGFGFGTVTPNLYNALADLSPLSCRSTVLAAGTGVSSLSQFLTPVVLGGVWATQRDRVFYVAAAVAIATAILVLWQGRARDTRKPG